MQTNASAFRTMSYLPKKFLEEIYFKTIIPAVLYTILVWGNCSSSMWNEIEKVHKSAARTIHKIDKQIPSEGILEAAKWDSIFYMYKKRLVLYMHKVYNGDTVNQVSDLFEKNKNCYGLRKKKNFKIPRVKTENARNSTRLRGPIIWNSLDDLGEWPSGLYSFHQVTEVKLGRVGSNSGWVTSEA